MPEAFWRYADPMLGDPAWFVRKALGWVLREHARRAPEEVAAWLEPRAGLVGSVTLREAVKYLAPGDREAIVAAAGRARPAPRSPRGTGRDVRSRSAAVEGAPDP